MKGSSASLQKGSLTCRQSALGKKECKLPISYPAREREIIKNMRALAKEKNIDPDLIEKIFKAIFKDAKRIQRYND